MTKWMMLAAALLCAAPARAFWPAEKGGRALEDLGVAAGEENVKAAKEQVPPIKDARGLEETEAPAVAGADPAAVAFCRRYDDLGILASLLRDHCLKSIANRSFDHKALAVCRRYDSYFPEIQCLGIIADHTFDPKVLDACDLFDSVALTNQCLEVVVKRSDAGAMELIRDCWHSESDRWASRCLGEVVDGKRLNAEEKDDTNIRFLGLKRFVVGLTPDSILDAYLEAKFRLEHNLGSGEGWEHQRRFEALKDRYLRELEEGRKLRKYE